MATPVVSNGAVDTVGAAFPGVSIVAAGLQVGDVMAVGAMTFQTNSGSPYTWTCGNSGGGNTDSLGNVYTERVYMAGPGAFKEIHVWTTKVTFAGSPTIIVKRVSPGTSNVANVGLVAYRDAGDFDQATPYLANFTPSDVTYATGCGTGTFTYADTLIVTFENNPGGTGAPASDDHSFTGDTRIGDVDSGPAGRLVIWARVSTGPGNGRVEIGTVPSGDNTLCTVTFSKPLARTVGLVTQYAVRSGAGFQNQVAPFSDNRPMLMSLPYVVSLGSRILVGIGQQSAALTGLGVSDAYGNSYVEKSSDSTHSKITVFETTVAHIPAAGVVFQITLAGTPNVLTTIYQSTEIGVVEISPPDGFDGATQFAVFLSQTGSSPTVTSRTHLIADVPAGSLLVAWSIVSGVDNGSLTWVPQDSYSLKQHQDFVQYIGEDVNRYRLGPMAMFEKTAGTDDDYDARCQVTAQADTGLGENILLAAIPLSPSFVVTCPVDGGEATVGIPYSSQVVVTGGTPPYTFTLV